MKKTFGALMICLAFSWTWSMQGLAQGNGGDRGGGGEIAAEVLHLAQEIGGKQLRPWVKDGTLKKSNGQPALTEAEIRAVERIVDLNDKERSNLLEVYTFPRVYRHPEFLPDTRKADEVPLVNIYKLKPGQHPRIEVGTIEWKALEGKAIEKMFLVLHELLGAAGILKEGERIDAAFLISYQLKLKALKDWETYKEGLKLKAMQILSEETRFAKPNMVALKCAFDNVKNMSQYRKVMDPKKYVEIPAGQQPSAWDLFEFQHSNYLEVLLTWAANLADLKKNSDAELIIEHKAIDAILAEAKQPSRKDIPESWQNWGNKLVTQLDQAMVVRAAIASSMLTSEDIFNTIDKKCSDHDPIKTLNCLDEFAHNDLPEMNRKESEAAVSDFGKMFRQFLGMMASAVSPDEIR